MTFERLLAKSCATRDGIPESATLAGHLTDVHTAANQILASSAAGQLAAVGLRAEDWGHRFSRIVLAAAAVHDLGKANDHFQEMVRRERELRPQAIRHEWVTLLILIEPGWKEWLLPALASEQDWPLLLWTIVGHHRQPPAWAAPDGGGSEMRVLLAHDDMRSILGDTQGRLALRGPPAALSLRDVQWTLTGSHCDNPFPRLREWHNHAVELWERDYATSYVRRFLAIAKACLIAADVGGSALPRAGLSISGYIRDGFARAPTPDELLAIVRDRLTPPGAVAAEPLRPFQQQVAQSRARVSFVRAGCGSGKTIAAYSWAGAQHPGKRLYFCYPTTGTATEGFRDYLFDELAGTSKFGADLFHGRAHVDLELILGVDEDRNAALDSQVRLESLDAWSTPIVSCTVDTVLGLVQNHRRGLYAWPALARSAFIFDEIHAYDDRLFNALLEFLTLCDGAPALLMSASLPAARLAVLRRKLAAAGDDLPEPIRGPQDLEELPRYYRVQVEDREVAELVTDALQQRLKVLWVCNRVGRAMDAFDRIRAAGADPLLYHSRFRYVDRVQRHKAVIEAFRSPGAALAICTQVAEMSLDLSADLLVTDLAPVPSIIQRLGRLNRRALPPQPGRPPPRRRPFVVLEPKNDDGSPAVLPYSSAELERAGQWLQRLGAGSLSQSDLAGAWESLDPNERFHTTNCNWVSGGPVTEVGDLREPSPGLSIVLDEDAERVRSGELALVAAIIPMNAPPRSVRWEQWPRSKGVPIAGSGVMIYDRLRGGGWRA